MKESYEKILKIDNKIKIEESLAKANKKNYKPNHQDLKMMVDEFVLFTEQYMNIQLLLLKNLSIRTSIPILVGMVIIIIGIMSYFVYQLICWKIFRKKYLFSKKQSFYSLMVFLPIGYLIMILKSSIVSLFT